MSIANLLSKAKEIFTQKPDQADLDQQEKLISELTDLNILMSSKEGKVLINWLKGEVVSTIQNLIRTREDKYISDLESKLNLFNKLTSSKNDLKLIEDYLAEEINKYEQE
jgi:hypothetical protein